MDNKFPATVWYKNTRLMQASTTIFLASKLSHKKISLYAGNIYLSVKLSTSFSDSYFGVFSMQYN